METQFSKRSYTKSQANLLMKSMLIAGIAFIIMGLASYGWSVMFSKYLPNVQTGLLIFFVMLISGMVISLLWMKNMLSSGSAFLTILCYALYLTTNSLAFGWLFSLAVDRAELYWLPVLFLITGGVFLLALLFAKITTTRGVLTMGKVIGSTAIAMMIIMLVFLILMIVFMTTRNEGVVIAGDTLCSILMVGMALISFLYVIIDIWQISKASQFMIDETQPQNKLLPWFFGYKLLTDLVNVLFVVLMIFIRMRGRK